MFADSLSWTDTLDLQDKTSPTAQDHSRQPQHPAPLGIGPAAPHQEASLRQVAVEQSTEEAQLRDSTWSTTATLRDDPGSDDERTVVNAEGSLQQDEQAVRLNGGMADDGNMEDADVDDLDDDMMDKISSSPSIDDGGYSLPSTPPWPARMSSLAHSPGRAVAESPLTSSSPFTTTPIHFPLQPAAASRLQGTLAVGQDDTPTMYSSMSTAQLSSRPQFLGQNVRSLEHHQREYQDLPLQKSSYRLPKDTNEPPGDKELTVVEDRLRFMLQNTQDSSFTSESSEIDPQARDFLRRSSQDAFRVTEATIDEGFDEGLEDSFEDTFSLTDSDSWTTDSDEDSVFCDNYSEPNNDDDSKDPLNDSLFLNSDSRFIDSGWGGECLRETEDIDFEFVYALHTFVATVEGQANATKGDTMVLLDDSNSYWWLVRVVKDSSIGM